MLTEVLWPAGANLRVDAIVLSAEKLRLTVQGTQGVAACPQCQMESRRTNGFYTRYPADLPCAGFNVQLSLTVPRFFCDNDLCSRRTFAARFPGMLDPYARRTNRLRGQQQQVGFAVNGETGARLLEVLGMKTSPDTLIRLVRQAPEPEFETPSVLGIDDWAKRKGQTYGTILVDLERHQVIDLLPDRSAESISQWLEAHPGVQIVSRDRGADYIEGVTAGAPNAVQIADRFHLFQNVIDALKRLLGKRTKQLRQAAHQVAVEMSNNAERCFEATKPAEITGVARASQEKQPTISELRFEEVKTLQAQGWSKRAIAKHLNLSRRTVARYFVIDTCPKRRPVSQSVSSVAPHLAYLSERWHAGCQSITQLYDELKDLGFGGHYASVYRAIKRMLKDGTITSSPTTQPRPVPRLSLTEATWLLVHSDDRLDETQLRLRDHLCMVDAKISTAQELVQSFCEILRQRLSDKLDDWLWQAEQSGLSSFRNFAASLRRDYDAVRAALTHEWSQGQVEGQVNRLKFIKRSMYGRAKFDLLRKRVLGPPVPTRHVPFTQIADDPL